MAYIHVRNNQIITDLDYLRLTIESKTNYRPYHIEEVIEEEEIISTNNSNFIQDIFTPNNYSESNTVSNDFNGFGSGGEFGGGGASGSWDSNSSSDSSSSDSSSSSFSSD